MFQPTLFFLVSQIVLLTGLVATILISFWVGAHMLLLAIREMDEMTTPSPVGNNSEMEGPCKKTKSSV